ncbi:hypothetical protein L917_15345 [Phytophthora nicotianae]|uniref:Uncharacterized protein n=4 Tax=Phytophthora nicotianae TaxID=4792 RepID=W2PR61_PHYN3|nr:hypothetical protein PPTG_15638 [Phytophthora nicotianae INRA-310]ETI38069.1 hypothetical protein F443_16083 [Phytophthora nicotianae P1569]ETL84945.1 hypothetical protein L917_15345 [Phytophthora nicotianae]ETM38114.1 hypothetical protein L914_15478 [Phytophthora nicotianae]ETN03382.1 hypothetical protein PPTG_15638 [Phytophthora nicotianae INRA-310]
MDEAAQQAYTPSPLQFLKPRTMRLSKHARTKKGSVAPMNDDDSSDSVNLHHSSAYQSRHEFRGVSFSTSRGKIWLILIINLSVVTMFIFMSSIRFPSLNGENIVNDALEHEQHPRPINKNTEQALSLTAVDSPATKVAQVQDTSRPGGYSKLTSTEYPQTQDKELDSTDATDTETVAPLSVTLSDDTGETPVVLANIQEKKFEMPSLSVTRQAEAPVSDVDINPYIVSADAQGDTSSVPASSESYTGQRSPAEIADIISNMKESQDPSSEILPPSSEQPDEAKYSVTTSNSAPQSVETKTPAVEPEDFLDNMSLWLTSESGVEVENLAACLASSGEDITACGVTRWTNQIVSTDPNAADSTAFRPVSQHQRPVWIPIVPDTNNQLPTVYFTCPMVTDTLRVHELMTLLFVISPAHIETGDSSRRQKFFGNSPYGQFALRGGKPSFFANNGLVESAYELPTGQFSLVTYRLNRGYVEIKVSGGAWGGELPVEGDERHIRITVNDVVSLGNSKGVCDTNAFQGRIAEVLVYDAVLDNTKIEEVEKYLHEKWWGHKPFPTASPTATVAPTESVASEVVHSDNPVDEAVSVAPANYPQVTQQTSSTKKPLAGDTQQASTTTEIHPTDHDGNGTQQKIPGTEAEDVSLVPKFDPRVNIFEWTAPSDVDPAKAARWRSTVKEKVDYIRNFQLGGDVLRTLIRQHKDELVALRDELFG